MNPEPKIALRDVFLLASSLALTAGGAFLWIRRREDAAIAVTAFFGCCTAVFAGTLLRKHRQRGQEALSVRVAGGVAIRQSRGRALRFGALTLAAGLTLALAGHALPLGFRASAWAMAAAGAVLLGGTAARRFPAGWLRFDPAGLTVGTRRWAVTIPWDDVVEARPGELHDNAVAYIRPRAPARLEVRPAERRDAALRVLAFNEGHLGAPIVIFTAAYGMALPYFIAALERYISDPAARAELAVRPSLGAPPP